MRSGGSRKPADSRRSGSSRSAASRGAASPSRPASTDEVGGAVTDGAASGGVGRVVKKAVVPVATAAAGIIGGVVLERRHRRPRKVLGIPIPGSGDGLTGIAKEVNKAGKQLGKPANEVQETRRKAEDVGKALS